jgi:hypothetical protein
MKKIRWVIFVVLLLVFAFIVFANPGSEADPLVSKSYVDGRISEIMRVLEGHAGGASSGGGAAFTPVSVAAGQTIYAGEGTEIILRSGRGVIVTATDGVTNATTGADLRNSAAVAQNNLLIFPRDDGRGIRVTSNAWFIVKGAYTVR